MKISQRVASTFLHAKAIGAAMEVAPPTPCELNFPGNSKRRGLDLWPETLPPSCSSSYLDRWESILRMLCAMELVVASRSSEATALRTPACKRCLETSLSSFFLGGENPWGRRQKVHQKPRVFLLFPFLEISAPSFGGGHVIRRSCRQPIIRRWNLSKICRF